VQLHISIDKSIKNTCWVKSAFWATPKQAFAQEFLEKNGI
jgi:hypothetical protein